MVRRSVYADGRSCAAKHAIGWQSDRVTGAFGLEELVYLGIVEGCVALKGETLHDIPVAGDGVGRGSLPDRRVLAIVDPMSPQRGDCDAAGELEGLFAPLTGFLSDLSLAGDNTNEVNPAASGLAAEGRTRCSD